MSILCGNKKAHTEKTYHPTTADVRACFAGQNSMRTAEPRTKQAPEFVTNSAILDRLRTQHERNAEAREMQRRERQDDERAYASKQMAPTYRLASPKQVSFLRSLLASREIPGREQKWADDLTRALGNEDLGQYPAVPLTLGMKEASEAITKLKNEKWFPVRTQHSPSRAAAAAVTVTQDGMYQNPKTGEIYKVQWNRAGGDGRRLYAKKLVEDKYGDESSDNARFGTSFRFAYTPGLIDKIRPEWKMTREQASAFGRLYGICVRCHRDLTDEESIAMGIGPICAGKEGWA